MSTSIFDVSNFTEVTSALTNISNESIGFWMLIGVALVFFMQAGFAMVETGFTRAKNAGNIIMKNLMDFCLGSVVFWVLGYGLLCGDSIGGIIGTPINPLSESINWPQLMFNMVFCATAATIVSGAMAERTKFSSYCIYSLLISLVVYPISAHWIWNENGWLAEMGFVDFAGSTAVHMVGGVAALIGAKILGPRLGKYGKNGKPKAIPGHNITLGALGVFILWFCWYGFNGCAATTVDHAAKILITTTIAASTATISVMLITWIRFKKPDVSMTLNGSLAGLVAITAGCANVSPLGAFFIGLIASFVVVFGIEFIDKVLKIDDPVGAIGVHGCCGAIGTILVGLFHTEGGLFYGGGLNLLGTQLLGVIAVIAWVSVTMIAIFTLIKKTVGLRVSREEEIVGLDRKEHGLVSAYADFMPMPHTHSLDGNVDIEEVTVTGSVPEYEALPVETIRRKMSAADLAASDSPEYMKFTKVTIICKQSTLEALKSAMNNIGVTGMTVTQVLGCGAQKGTPEYYRGVPLEVSLLPKIQVDSVVCKVPVRTVINVAKKVLYTGHIGDGKIFVYDVENVVKVRSGEEGYDALQDD